MKSQKIRNNTTARKRLVKRNGLPRRADINRDPEKQTAAGIRPNEQRTRSENNGHESGKPAINNRYSAAGRDHGTQRNGRHRRKKPRTFPVTDLEFATHRYSDLYDFAPLPYVSFDRTGRIEELNFAAGQLFGRSRTSLVGLPLSIHVVPEDIDLFLSHLLHCRKLEKQVTTDLRMKNRNGEVIFAQLTSRPVNAPGIGDGAMLFQTAIVDLTERKKNEQRLAEQARLLDLTTDAIIVRDRNDRILYWNNGAERMYGYSREEALGRVTHNLLKTEHPQPLPDIYSKLYRDQRWEGEMVHYHKAGRSIITLSRWALDDPTGRQTILETNTDITGRKKAEEARLESEEQIRATVEQAVAGMARSDRDGRIVFANKRYCELVGYTESELIGKNASHFTHPEDMQRTAKLFAQLVKHGKAFELEKRYIRKDGSVVWVDVSASPIRDAKGKVHSAVAVVVDINDRKLAEKQLRRSKEMLEELVQKRTEALRLSNAELENEINRRRGLEGQILEVSDREQQRLAQELHDGLCQELTAIGFMARATALRVKNHRVVDADDMDKIASLVNQAATDARNISRALHRVDVDADGFVEAIQNLGTREIWKTPCRVDVEKGFEINSRTAAVNLYGIAREAVVNANKHAQARQILIELSKSQGEIVLRIADDGVGLKQSAQRSPGMGFHIMDYRARSIGGRLKVESKKGAGTSISCYLPAEQ